MILVSDNSNCCGCGACINICPQNAITMTENEYGFRYPRINKDKCINCGLCRKSCTFKNKNEDNKQLLKTYAAISSNYEIIKKSASGGIFAEITNAFLKNKGIVYGSSMNYLNDKLTVEHIRVTDNNNIEKLQGSKYVQSNIESCYKDIENDLNNNYKVLFSGTPCQVDSIKKYLKNNKNIDNLYCIDIICHGVPNNRFFNEYINIIEKKYKGKIIDFKFRDKTRNWGLNAAAVVRKTNGNIKKYIIPSYDSSFYQLFLDSEIYRDSCYSCKYANEKRVGDITIGDFWKIENEHEDKIKENKFDINNGVSCILVNTNRGQELLEEYGTKLKLFESNFANVAKHNEQLTSPSKIRGTRKIILKLYKDKGYNEVNKYYWRKNIIKIILKKMWYILPLKVRSKLRK